MPLLTFNLTENEAAQVLLWVLKCVWDPGDKDGARKNQSAARSRSRNEQHPVKSLMDCFIYHSEHKQATKGKHAVVLYWAHFPRSAEKNEAFYFP